MSRPPNPYRDEVQKLESLGNAMSGNGRLIEANRFWRQAAALKRKGIEEVNREVESKRSGEAGALPMQ